jgi:protoheme IX farnesyltransferase
MTIRSESATKHETPAVSAAVRHRGARALVREYLELTKPRVVSLIMFTAVAGMFLSTPTGLPLGPFLFGTLGIALASASAAAINHILDLRFDRGMIRTSHRPLPSGSVSTRAALLFALILGVASMTVLVLWVNVLTAALTFASLIGYSIIYTVFLKHATPQNIVIGGAAGAAPPVLGWTAITGHVAPEALLLFLIIFLWTPPHFWALALYREKEYAKVGIPMLPVTHGREFTQLQILLYTILLVAVTIMPFATHMSGWLYLAGAAILDAGFLYYAVRLYRNYSDELAHKTFRYSINYLAVLFALLLVDHYSIFIREALQSALY